MIVEMHRGASEEQIQAVVQRAESYQFGVQINRGTDKVVVAILGGDTSRVSTDVFAVLPGVDSVTRIMRPYKLASREYIDHPSQVQVGDISVGGERLVMIAGPCAIESRDQLQQTARSVIAAGARVVRGGAFNPRTSPFSFQGLGDEGLQLMAELRRDQHVPVTSEIIDADQVDKMVDAVDLLQVGARNMQNYSLLRAVGQSGKPCLLKRGLAATVKEWLQAADYLLASGGQVILCERGIRTFEDSTRFTLDISSVAVIKQNSHLPVIVDPSHAAGHYLLVPALARAAIAAGADGLIVEVHPDPQNALSDSLQSLNLPTFDTLMRELRAIGQVMGRTFSLAVLLLRHRDSQMLAAVPFFIRQGKHILDDSSWGDGTAVNMGDINGGTETIQTAGCLVWPNGQGCPRTFYVQYKGQAAAFVEPCGCIETGCLRVILKPDSLDRMAAVRRAKHTDRIMSSANDLGDVGT